MQVVIIDSASACISVGDLLEKNQRFSEVCASCIALIAC